MFPSVPLISTSCKELYDTLQMEIPPESRSPQNHTSSASPLSPNITQSCSDVEINPEKEGQRHVAAKALDLSSAANIPSKKMSPLKHVTPILKKYNCHRKGKGSKKLVISKGISSDQMQEGMEKQCLRPIAPRPAKIMFSSAQEHQNVMPLLRQAVQNDEDMDTVETQEELICANEKSGPEGRKGTVNDERISDEKDMSAGEKDNEDDLLVLMSASTTVRPPKGRTANVLKKKSRQLKDMESTLALLTPDNPTIKEEKSYGLAQAYFLKVKERLEGTALYHEFLNIMNEFGTSILEVSDLYSKVTGVLKEHPDLCEEFVAFLLPEQAVQCGKFMEYLLITKMRDFFRKLEIYFEKQPQQVQKIYSCLSALSNTANVSVGDVCSAVVPLLKGNSLLVENFMALFPHEKPAESLMPEFEYVDLGDVDNEQLNEDDMFETLTVPDQQDAFGGDNCVCTCHNSHNDKYHSRAVHCMSCGTRFIRGRVFMQTGKILRPAEVVFVAESNSDSVNRLSAKSKPRRRNRRRTASQSECAGSSKDSSPAKPGNMNHSPDACIEANENVGGSNQMLKSNIKSSSPKCARTTKSKPSLTSHKVHEKSNAVKLLAVSAAFSNTDKDTLDHTEEPKWSGSAQSDQLDSNNETLFSTSPVVLSHNFASGTNSSTHTDALPEVLSRSSNSVQCPTLANISDPRTVSSTPNDAHAADRSDSVLSAASGQGMSSPDTVNNDGSALPSGMSSVGSGVKDTNTLTHAIPGADGVKCESVGTDCALGNAGGTGDARESVSEVMEVFERAEASVCGAAVADVMMSEHEEEASASGIEQIERKVEPAGLHRTHSGDPLSGSWTREEDRIILQTFQLDCGMEQTFIKIGERLQLRSLDEIKSRFQMLIALLHQMTGTKMEEDANISIQHKSYE